MYIRRVLSCSQKFFSSDDWPSRNIHISDISSIFVLDVQRCLEHDIANKSTSFFEKNKINDLHGNGRETWNTVYTIFINNKMYLIIIRCVSKVFNSSKFLKIIIMKEDLCSEKKIFGTI